MGRRAEQVSTTEQPIAEGELNRLDQRLDVLEGDVIPSLSERVRRLELRILVYLPIAVTLLGKAWDHFFGGVQP